MRSRTIVDDTPGMAIPPAAGAPSRPTTTNGTSSFSSGQPCQRSRSASRSLPMTSEKRWSRWRSMSAFIVRKVKLSPPSSSSMRTTRTALNGDAASSHMVARSENGASALSNGCLNVGTIHTSSTCPVAST